jgi:mono/diheme cytochrome c family protein
MRFARFRRVAWLSMFAAACFATGASRAAPVDGQQIFAANCALCHQPDGEGAAGLAPALAGTLKRFSASEAGRTYLSQIVVSGMVGTIETQAHKFQGLMPAFADRLSDAQIAAVIGYVLATFNAVPAPVVTARDVAAARARAPSASDTRHARLAALAAP